MDRERQAFAVRPFGHPGEERPADRVRRMGRYADPNPPTRAPPQRFDLPAEPRQALRKLGRVGTEHLLIDDSTSAELGQGLERRAGIAGIRNRGDPAGPALAQAAPGRLAILVPGARLLAGANVPDPRGKVGARLGALRKAGQLEMGMGIDEAGEEDCVAQV